MNGTRTTLARLDAYIRLHGAARRANPTPQRKIKLSAVESEAQTIEIFGTPDKPRSTARYLAEFAAKAKPVNGGRYVGPVIGHVQSRGIRGTVN
jgi:hypothetical protein